MRVRAFVRQIHVHVLLQICNMFKEYAPGQIDYFHLLSPNISLLCHHSHNCYGGVFTWQIYLLRLQSAMMET